MSIVHGGDQIRRDMAASEFAAAGLSSKAIEALIHAGVLGSKELLRSAWSDEEAGRKFACLQWRLSVSPYASAKLIGQIEACRARLLRDIGPPQSGSNSARSSDATPTP